MSRKKLKKLESFEEYGYIELEFLLKIIGEQKETVKKKKKAFGIEGFQKMDYFSVNESGKVRKEKKMCLGWNETVTLRR